MNRPFLKAWLPTVLIVLALAVLWLAAAERGLTLNHQPFFFVALSAVIVTFMTVVEVPLQGDGLSMGYAASLMVLLILGQPAHLLTAFIVIGAGGLFGGAIRAVWRARQAQQSLNWEAPGWAIVASTQLILSSAAGAWMYRTLNGLLPLSALPLSTLPALIGLLAASMMVYIGIYTLALRWRGVDVASIFADNRYAFWLAFLVPVPLMLAGVLLIQVSQVAFVIFSGGLFGLAVLSTEIGRQRLLFRQQVRELSSLSAVGRAMRANLDLNALIETIHLQVATLLEVDTFTLALYDPARELIEFPLSFRDGQRRVFNSRPLNKQAPQELIDFVIEQKAALLLEDNIVERANTRRLTPPSDVGTTWLGVPLLTSDRALGCIAIGSRDPKRRFTKDDRRLLTTIATQGAVSIDNAQLYRQTQERSRQLGMLNSLTTQLSGTLDSQAVLDMIAPAMTDIARTDGVALFVWLDELQQQTLAMVRSNGLSAAFRNNPPLPLLSGTMAAVPLVIGSTSEEPRDEPFRAALASEGFTSWVELPLRYGSEVLGMLVGMYRPPKRFSVEELEVLRAFANQSALSIHNARLYRRAGEALEQRIAQLSALASINQELASTLDLQHLFAQVLDYAITGTNSTGGALLLRPTASTTVPRIVAQRGRDIRKTAELLQQPTIMHALQTNQFTVEHSNLSELSVPIARDNDVMGVITMYSLAKGAYKPDDIIFVRQLATQAVIAVDNARLFSRIEESRARLQVILDSMHEAVLLIDANGMVLLANPQVNFMFELPLARITGSSVEALLADDTLDFGTPLGFTPKELTQLMAQIGEGRWAGGSNRLSYRIERPIVRFIDRTIVSTHTNSGQVSGVLMVFADATEERELVQAREDLTRMIVHDLRSPLTAISTSMRLLSEMSSVDPSLSRLLSRTTDASQRALRKLLHLVDSLLDIAKMESGSITLERADHMFAPIAQGVRLELLPLSEELEIKVEVLIPDSLPKLAIDAPKIERVLLNLVDNALKFTPIGGLVQVKAQATSDRAGFARIDVYDSGPGIPNNYKERIFDRFEQVDGSQGRRRGTGLGLTFCKLAVEAHGGHIWIEDNPGGGSVFAFTLPISALPNKTAAAEQVAQSRH